MKTAASLLVLTVMLSGCAATSSESTVDVPSVIARADAQADRLAAMANTAEPSSSMPATAEAARAFVAQAEKELGEFSLISAKAQWVNATYLTDDTDALAAHFGTIGTEMGVKFASQAARFNDTPGLDYDTRRMSSFLRVS